MTTGAGGVLATLGRLARSHPEWRSALHLLVTGNEQADGLRAVLMPAPDSGVRLTDLTDEGAWVPFALDDAEVA